jgi:hypothetical protein
MDLQSLLLLICLCVAAYRRHALTTIAIVSRSKNFSPPVITIPITKRRPVTHTNRVINISLRDGQKGVVLFSFIGKKRAKEASASQV